MSHELIAPLVQRLGWTLIHSLWQFAIVAILLSVVLRILRDRSPETRYIAGCVALVAMVLLAALTYAQVEVLDRSSPTATVVPSAHLLNGDAVLWNEDIALSPDLPDARSSVGGDAVAEPTENSAGVLATLEHRPNDPPPMESGSPMLVDQIVDILIAWKHDAMGRVDPWLDTLIAGWLVGVIVLSVRPLIGWYSARRLRTGGVQQVAKEVSNAVERIACRLGIARAVAVMQSSRVDVPTVIGALRPLILLPASALTGLPPEQLEAAIAHELGHVRRYDYAVNAAQVLLETLFFYHPAVWWVSHHVRVDRENCCDDMALAITGDRAGYAKMLVWLDERRGRAVATNPALSAAGGSLRSRVKRILRSPAQHPLRDSSGALTLGSVAAALFVSCFWLSTIAEKKSVGDEPASKTPENEFLLPRGVNEILGRIQPDMDEHRFTSLLRRFYPDSKERSISWSGKSGVVEYQLSRRYSLTVGQHTKPPDHDTRRLHPDASLSVGDVKEKRRITVTFNDWSQSEAWKDVTLVPDNTRGAKQTLLPAAINRILGQIRPEMPEQKVEEIVHRDFPDAKATQGPWSGQTGYVNFRLSSRFEISVGEYNDPNDFERRFVHRDLMMNVVDRMRKLTVRFQVAWNGGGIQVPEGLSAKGRELYRQTNPIQVAKDFLQRQRFDPSNYDMQNGSAVSYCPPQPTQYDWFVSFPNRMAGGDPLLVAVTNERRAWRLDPQTFDRIDELPATTGQDPLRTRSYTGRVVDETGMPIAEATLTVDEAVPFRTSRIPSDGRGSLANRKTAIVPAESQRVTTDHAGRFTFERLPADCRVSLFVTAESHTKRRIRIITGRPDDDRGLLSVLPPGQDIVLRRTVVVPIQVVFADTGRPAAKVRVLINHSSGVGSDQKVTDRDGKCVLQVPPGECRLRLAPSGASSDSATRYRGVIISADSDRGSDPLVFKLNRAAKEEDAHEDVPPKEPRSAGDGHARHDATARPATGTLTGRIVFDGPQPEPRFHDIFAPRTQRAASAGVEANRIGRVPDESLVIGKGNGLANAFVYLVANDNSPAWAADATPGPVTLRMQDNRIEPRAIALAPNHRLVVHNASEEWHDAHLMGFRNTWHVLLSPGSRREFPLRAEMLPVYVVSGCSPWMKANLLPHENDLFAVTASDGRFQIDNIPPGEWEIRFWHERAGYLKSNVAPNGRVTRSIPPRGVDLNVIKVAPSLFEPRIRTSADGVDTGRTPARTGPSGNDEDQISNDDSVPKQGNRSTSSFQDVRQPATVDDTGGASGRFLSSKTAHGTRRTLSWWTAVTFS